MFFPQTPSDAVAVLEVTSDGEDYWQKNSMNIFIASSDGHIIRMRLKEGMVHHDLIISQLDNAIEQAITLIGDVNNVFVVYFNGDSAEARMPSKDEKFELPSEWSKVFLSIYTSVKTHTDNLISPELYIVGDGVGMKMSTDQVYPVDHRGENTVIYQSITKMRKEKRLDEIEAFINSHDNIPFPYEWQGELSVKAAQAKDDASEKDAIKLALMMTRGSDFSEMDAPGIIEAHPYAFVETIAKSVATRKKNWNKHDYDAGYTNMPEYLKIIIGDDYNADWSAIMNLQDSFNKTIPHCSDDSAVILLALTSWLRGAAGDNVFSGFSGYLAAVTAEDNILVQSTLKAANSIQPHPWSE